MARRADSFKGIDLTSPLNRIEAGKVAMAENVRAYIEGGFTLRNPLSGAIIVVDSSVHTLIRMNDTTPAGPDSGYCYIIGTDSGSVFVGSTRVATGQSGDPVSMIPMRPNTSVRPWDYIFDDAPFPNVTVDSGYNCTGNIKVSSTGISRKMGIQEPQVAPIVSTSGTTDHFSGTLNATSVPWTNFAGQNTTNYNYSQTTQPGTGGVTAPFIIALPTGSQSVTITITGTATVNGSVHGPGDAGPGGAGFPGNFATTPKIVIGAFTDGSGNVLPPPSPIPIVIGVGAGGTFQVPAGAVQMQLGIDSNNAGFPANVGSFAVTGFVTISSVATKPSTLGNVTAYVWGDSPHSGPVTTYIWKNPSDVGAGIPRSIGTAPVTTTNNSWQIDTTPAAGNPTALPNWDTLASNGSVTGEIPLFPAPFPQSTPNTTNFNTCIIGTIFFPAGGTYTLTLTYKDQIMLGIGGGITATYLSGTAPASYSPNGKLGQTISVASGLPLLFVSQDGNLPTSTTTLQISVPGAGSYQFELDWDFWFHSGRSLVMTINSSVIPPLPSGTRSNVVYWYTWEASETGAESNPSPPSSPQVTPVLDNVVTPTFSPDPQVDKTNYYRQDNGLANPVFVGQGPNTNPPTPIIDSQSDLAVSNNRQLQFDNFEPVPSIDLPNSGTCNVTGGVITATSGQFNTRWLAGTTILIGAPPPVGVPTIPQVAYRFIARPTSNTQVVIPGVPDGANLLWNIAEPILAAQPLAYASGPTDNINYVFAVGDPRRPGTLYWSKASNLDAWPDTNQFDVTDPNEPLVNVALASGLGVLFSIKRAWVIVPNFFNALATVTGTSGSTWTMQATSISRGLFIPRCLVVEGGGRIFFRVDDGIHISRAGSASISITDGELYPLFAHESVGAGLSVPQPIVRNGVTIFPPDDSKPDKQKFSIQNGYMYYDHVGTDGQPHTWVLDLRTEGWVWDTYAVGPPTAHGANEGESQQGTLVGCKDATVRLMVSDSGAEVVAGNVVGAAMGGVGWMTAYEATIEYSCDSGGTVSFFAADFGNGSYAPQPIVLDATAGQIAKFTTKVSPNKWKLIQPQFQSTDQSFQVYQEGCVLSAKPWGSNGPFAPVPFFLPAGGRGPQE